MEINELFEKQIHHQNEAISKAPPFADCSIDIINDYVFFSRFPEKLERILSDIINNDNRYSLISVEGENGSGKSYFMKMINYCLNKQYREAFFSKLNKDIEDDCYKYELLGFEKKLNLLSIKTIELSFANEKVSPPVKDKSLLHLLFDKLYVTRNIISQQKDIIEYSLENFSHELIEYLDSNELSGPKDNRRLLFLIDDFYDLSQDDLLLLQSLSIICDKRIYFIFAFPYIIEQREAISNGFQKILEHRFNCRIIIPT